MVEHIDPPLSSEGGCPDETALEAYALGRRNLDTWAQHIETCASCQAQFRVYRAEASAAVAVLGSGVSDGEPTCDNALLLGRYLDQSLGDEARAELEAHLATCSYCVAWLAWRYRENRKLLSSHETVSGVRLVEAIPEGRQVSADFSKPALAETENAAPDVVEEDDEMSSDETRKRRFL